MHRRHRTARPTTLDSRDLSNLVAELATAPNQWRGLARFDSSGRWWRQLRHDDSVDVWLLTWLTGHSTDLHDHGGSAGAFTVVEGALTEVRVGLDRRSRSSSTITAGRAMEISPTVIHDVYNAGPAPAISLHAYSPPLSRMNFYSVQSTGVSRLKTVETDAAGEPHGASHDASRGERLDAA